MGFLKALRAPVLVLALLWVTLYLPFAATVYTPQWYSFHCSWSSECRFAEHFEPSEAAGELAAFLAHRGEPDAAWPPDEREQLEAVRSNLDRLFAATLGALFLLVVTFGWNRLATAARVNVVAIPVLALVTGLSFRTFWVEGLLPLLGVPMVVYEDSVAAFLMSEALYGYSLFFGALIGFLINLVLVWQVRPQRRSIFR
ncbi:MAG: hypothetical protein ACQERR_05930 [Pseudomonadota bacterium]